MPQPCRYLMREVTLRWTPSCKHPALELSVAIVYEFCRPVLSIYRQINICRVQVLFGIKIPFMEVWNFINFITSVELLHV